MLPYAPVQRIISIDWLGFMCSFYYARTPHASALSAPLLARTPVNRTALISFICSSLNIKYAHRNYVCLLGVRTGFTARHLNSSTHVSFINVSASGAKLLECRHMLYESGVVRCAQMVVYIQQTNDKQIRIMREADPESK